MKRNEIIAYIQDVKFGYLATIGADNAPHVRPIGMYALYAWLCAPLFPGPFLPA